MVSGVTQRRAGGAAALTAEPAGSAGDVRPDQVLGGARTEVDYDGRQREHQRRAPAEHAEVDEPAALLLLSQTAPPSAGAQPGQVRPGVMSGQVRSGQAHTRQYAGHLHDSDVQS